MKSPKSWFIKRRKTKIVIIFILIFLIVGSQLAKRSMNELRHYGPKEEAQVPEITSAPWDFNTTYAVSYFRSGVGHDYTYHAWDGEVCRSMKHYINFPYVVNGVVTRSIPEKNERKINLYAPFDGVFSIRMPGIDPTNPNRKVLGIELQVHSAENHFWYIRFMHVDAIPGLKSGSRVKSGELIGSVGPRDAFDISYEANIEGKKVAYLSVFAKMTPNVFAPFSKLGMKQNDFILTSAQADAKNYRCMGPGGWQLFVQNKTAACDEPCLPPGYVFVRPNPYPQSGRNATLSVNGSQ